jgi:luciferase family oxidoreductase group 1
MPTIASSATSVLIAHVAAHTKKIRLGAGGIMLPNHSPLTIAEQFGTLETLHPGRIELGLGRAPGSDQATLRALRRDASSSDNFPQDVLELQGYLSGDTVFPGVDATPGKGTNVPLYILGSSLFGARLAAALGLPFAFASHFAPQALLDAAAIYRREFKPSAQLDKPRFIAGFNVIVADTDEQAQAQAIEARHRMISLFFGRGRTMSREESTAILESPSGQQMLQMRHYSAVGTTREVKESVDRFAEHSQADELIVVTQSPTSEARLRSYELLADVSDLVVA